MSLYNRYHQIALFVLISILLNSCYQQNLLHHEKIYVFGTIVEISLWGIPEKQASEAVNLIAKDFQTMHKNWHAWHPSPLTHLNQAIRTGQKWTVEEDSLIPLLEQAKQLYQLSEGLFNPAIGQLIALWGFHGDELPVGPPPSDSAITELVARAPGMDTLQIVGREITCSNSSVQLDMGAFAKGYAIDVAIKRLQSLGIHHAIVNAGGNLKVIGRKNQQPWAIGIRHPNGGILARLTTEGEESIVTSGNYERYREYQGIRYSHIIDPRSGWPVQDLSSVTVIHSSGAVADAASTALTVAGLSNWRPIAQKMGIHHVMFVDKAGTVYMNSAMAQRVQFDPQNPPKSVIIE